MYVNIYNIYNICNSPENILKNLFSFKASYVYICGNILITSSGLGCSKRLIFNLKTVGHLFKKKGCRLGIKVNFDFLQICAHFVNFTALLFGVHSSVPYYLVDTTL